MTVVSGDTADGVLSAARRECWRALPESTRVTYTWPLSGQPRDTPSVSPLIIPIRTFPLLTLVCWFSIPRRSITSRSAAAHKTDGSTGATTTVAGLAVKSTLSPRRHSGFSGGFAALAASSALASWSKSAWMPARAT